MKRLSTFDKVFDIIVTIISVLCLLVVLYPLYYIFIASFSSSSAVTSGKVILLPHDITFRGYEMVFERMKEK